MLFLLLLCFWSTLAQVRTHKCPQSSTSTVEPGQPDDTYENKRDLRICTFFCLKSGVAVEWLYLFGLAMLVDVGNGKTLRNHVSVMLMQMRCCGSHEEWGVVIHPGFNSNWNKCKLNRIKSLSGLRMLSP